MSTEANKALLHRWLEAFNTRNLAVVDELCAPNWVWHGAASPPGISPDRVGLKQNWTALWTAFPDAHIVAEDVIAEGDKVVWRPNLRGTHQGDFMGIPPTGKQVSLIGIEIDRIEDDRFVESWISPDNLGFLQQLGAIPQMAQGGA
jgi:steroid delta-isomerase-like uncharacterized protein